MEPPFASNINVIDSHTAGEPTRVIVSGAPEPEGATMAEKRHSFARDLDHLRTATVCEPRGHDAIVGAMLCQPAERNCAAGVVFFNNVGVLNGCLHGTMGVAVTLMHMGKIGPGEHRIDTPTGVVTVIVSESGNVSVRNVRSYRHLTQIEVTVPGHRPVAGDVAWGGNWFFLAEAPPDLAIEAANIEKLTEYTWGLRNQLRADAITGTAGAEIDHIELFGPPASPAHADSRNFVLCPGKAYDRSPCGTGTSAKLACLHADGKLQPGQVWKQSGILETVFESVVEAAPEGGVYPTVSGSAYITGQSQLYIDPEDPFAYGIPTSVK